MITVQGTYQTVNFAYRYTPSDHDTGTIKRAIVSRTWVSRLAPPVNKVTCCSRLRAQRGGTHLLGQSAGLLGRVEDFVVEDGEVEGQAEPDGVRRLHVLLADVEGLLVGLLRVVHRVFKTHTTVIRTTCFLFS